MGEPTEVGLDIWSEGRQGPPVQSRMEGASAGPSWMVLSPFGFGRAACETKYGASWAESPVEFGNLFALGKHQWPGDKDLRS